MITKANLLIRRFSKYSVDVEVKLLEPTAGVFTTLLYGLSKVSIA